MKTLNEILLAKIMAISIVIIVTATDIVTNYDQRTLLCIVL